MATRKTKKPPTQHRAPADEHAATELVLYIENTSDLSPDGPSGQGRSVLLNALRKWRRGTYDPTMAVRLFEYLTESGAKRYAKEMGSSEKEWSTMFTPATRHEAAKQLEASFRHAVEHGEYDHVDTKIGARESTVEAHRDESGYQFIDEAEGKYGLERLSLEKISVGAPRRTRWVFAFRMGIDEQDIAKGGFHWISADKPLEAEKLWFEHTRRRITLQQRAQRVRESHEHLTTRETILNAAGVADRKQSMTFGTLPSFADFKNHVHTAINPETDEPYWPEGTTYPMELVSSREIELARDFGGLDDFRTERHRTGRNTRATGFRGNEKQIYDFLTFLVDQEDAYSGEEDSAGSLASSIMTTLGYEWI